MKIMSWNINNFGGLNTRKPLWEEFQQRGKEAYREALSMFQTDPYRLTVAEKIVSKIEYENPDIIVFEEFDVDAPAGKKAIMMFEERGYQPILPDKEKKIRGNYSITMMFVKNRLQTIPCASPIIKAWKWCIAEINNLKIVGVHIPSDQAFLDELERYAVAHITEKLIILGDFNIATNTGRTEKREKELEDAKKAGNGEKIADCKEFFQRRDWLLKVMQSGYIDAVERESVTYFPERTTIDHVLVSEKLKDSVAAQVIPEEVPELSDHAVIIVDIKE